MDWNLKTPSWDLSEFEQQSIPNIETLDGSSGFEDHKTNGGCWVDLNLGRVSNFGEESVKESRVSKMAVSPSASKRARAATNGSHPASCLVDGCKSDLTNSRDYHRRHKVCELHSKTPQVLIGGQKQRFCQQCSRFHSLEEFDDVKRSCRKRLEGHNRRRRKPQPDTLSHSGSFLSTYQGSKMLPFSSSQIYPTTAVSGPSWAGVVKTEEDTGKLYSQQAHLNFFEQQSPFQGSSARNYRDGGKQFCFLQGPKLGNSVCHPFLNEAATSATSGPNRKLYSDGLTRVPDSDCALSLLSSSPTQSLSHVVHPSSIPTSLHYNGMEPMESVLVSSGSECQGIFQMVPDGSSSGNDGPQTLPFYWE